MAVGTDATVKVPLKPFLLTPEMTTCWSTCRLLAAVVVMVTVLPVPDVDSTAVEMLVVAVVAIGAEALVTLTVLPGPRANDGTITATAELLTAWLEL